MEAATENLQDEVKCILNWIRHGRILKGTSYGRSIETGEHLTRWRRPSECREHGGGGRERLWQRLGPQQPGLHLGQVFIPVKNCLNLRTCCQEGEGQTVGQLDSPP